jgi:hypothetical protein
MRLVLGPGGLGRQSRAHDDEFVSTVRPNVKVTRILGG